jgi:hypothetical protein
MFGHRRLRKRLAELGVNVDDFTPMTQTAEEHANEAPTQFPDGTPFPAREHLHALADALLAIHGQRLPDSTIIGGHLHALMQMLRDPYEPVDPALLTALEGIRRSLAAGGNANEASAVGNALDAYRRFHQG